MDTDLAPIDVASHRPFLRRNLALERWPAAALALGVLAARQVECDGQAVRLGTNHWKDLGLTAGETGRIRMVLLELERRRVIGRYRGAGARANAWTFLGSVRHWDAMPWTISGRDAHRVICGCIYRAACPGIARFAGQGVGLSRGSGGFCLSDADHLSRPGILPVETRANGASRAIPGHRPGLLPVEPRANGAVPRPLFLSTEIEELIEGEGRERFALLIQSAEAKSAQEIWARSKPWAGLAALAAELTDRQVSVLADELAKWPTKVHVGNVVDISRDIAAEREVKMAGRDHPAGMELPDYSFE